MFTSLDVRLIFILSSTTNWYLEVRIQARDKQYSFCLLIPGTSWKDWLECHVVHNTCITEETPRRRRLGQHQSCYRERINILSNSIECYHPSRNTSSLLYSESCQNEDWRSLLWISTHVTRPPPKISLRHDWTKNWVQKLLDSHEKKLFDSHEEKLPDEQNSSNQPNQSQSQSVKRSGQLDNTQGVFVVKS